MLVIAFAMFALLIVGWLVAPEKATEVEVLPVVGPGGVPTAVPTAV